MRGLYPLPVEEFYNLEQGDTRGFACLLNSSANGH